jgi:hypothetical protein
MLAWSEFEIVSGCAAAHPDRRGGQHVAKTCTGVRVTHRATGISEFVDSERSQHANQELAVARLEVIVDELRQEELDELRMVARRVWTYMEWDDPDLYAEQDGVFPLRCSVPPSAALSIGEDLPGSWHQQSNGGARPWTSAAGEFEAR